MAKKRYALLCKEYKKLVEAKNIEPVSKKTYLDDINKIFESLLAGLTEEGIEALVKGRGFKRTEEYRHIIRDLKDIIKERER
ncbi:MAG: hypothetical protein HY769_02655 [Candidatus Stahlbacteria bacterium]|nr:hypothetical protein [Candidatus Stahlbacteria bacterium]